MKYLITYDLMTPGRDYSSLYTAIKDLSSDYRKMQNVWFVKTPYSASQIRDALKNVVDGNDKIFVCSLNNDWASLNLQDVAAFLNS